MKIDIRDKRDCCGCTACSTACPNKAITMEPDIMGFLYPRVNDELCTECGLCVKTCQFHEGYLRNENFEVPIVYGVRHKDENELAHSQSGAASWAIIEAFLEEHGSVYGAAFESVYHVKHRKATSINDAQAFRCSKYIQSDLDGVFKQIKTDLRSGERVLFIGTGCQVAGLKAAIPVKWQNTLITVDLVCHATPSPAVWESFVHYIEDKYNKKVTNATFRNKKYGWHSHIETLEFEDGTQILESTSFRKLFYDHVIVRPSCTVCHFTNLKRVSDITICDFWGWEKYYTEWNDNKGVSVMMINSKAGLGFFDRIKGYVDYIESDTEKCFQPQMGKPVQADIKVIKRAENIFSKGGYVALAKAYGDKSYKFLIKENIRTILRFLGLR